MSSSDTVEYKRAPPQGRGPSEHIQMDKTGRANEILFKQCFASGLIVWPIIVCWLDIESIGPYM